MLLIYLFTVCCLGVLGAGKSVHAGSAAPLPRSGQTTSYATRDDGALLKGVVWPTPRFTDNGDETVTDNLTGLMWKKDANAGADCGTTPGTATWANALISAKTCNDNSFAGYTDWRLPTVKELESLISDDAKDPVLPTGHPFSNLQSYGYWSSTTYSANTSNAWYVGLNVGVVNTNTETSQYYVWPVRGGQ
jgi:hypothetical protein